MCSKVCFLMTWFWMRQIKVTFMQHNVVKIIWTFSRMKLGFLLQFYCCKATAKFHIEIFIGQIHLTHTLKKSHVQWPEIDFERYYQNFIWLATQRLQKIDTTKCEYYLKCWISISNSMVHLSIKAVMKALSLTIENTAQNNLLEEIPLGLSLNFGALLIWSISSSCRTMLWYCWVDTDFPDINQGQVQFCVGFDWKVWGKSWISHYIWQHVYLTPIVRWAEWTWNY